MGLHPTFTLSSSSPSVRPPNPLVVVASLSTARRMPLPSPAKQVVGIPPLPPVCKSRIWAYTPSSSHPRNLQSRLASLRAPLPPECIIWVRAPRSSPHPQFGLAPPAPFPTPGFLPSLAPQIWAFEERETERERLLN
ncbi:hypothetical protein TIFTF001_025374 [Ficus carica]|uniref:Uncharacterized protein n=1 Tax=Ficus carica TaxID=3494 RepID=A0AA88ANN1_FICCA|nr:hypothetical protein TIFTF001_025374 [Ficus carica]